MKHAKKLQLLTIALICAALFMTVYAFSFDTIEPVCEKTADREYFLLNYVSKSNLKGKVYLHNQDISFGGKEFKRVYLLHYIFEIPDPVWDSKIDYRKDGCGNLDNSDIYCEVRFTRLPNGTIETWYNFME